MNSTEEQLQHEILKDAHFLSSYVELVYTYHSSMCIRIIEKDVNSSLYTLYNLQNEVNCLKRNVDYMVEKYDKEIQELLKGLE